jgi:hypothetical protein
MLLLMISSLSWMEAVVKTEAELGVGGDDIVESRTLMMAGADVKSS